MKNKSATDTRPEILPWPVILTTLTLLLVSAWLVLVSGWELWEAFGVVAVAAFGIISALLAVIMTLSSPEERTYIWQQLWVTCRADLDLLLKFFWIKTGK